MRKRIFYSQNFLRDRHLASLLINKSSITKKDVVFEIGSGQGVITRELLKRSARVVAFEIDKNLFAKLGARFAGEKNLLLKCGNFLDFPLPHTPYKIFSNIPFKITAAVINKLTSADCPPRDAYLFVQKEAAKKFVGKPYANKNSLIAVLLKQRFGLDVVYEFKRSDFFPKPNVDVVLVKIEKTVKPRVPKTVRGVFGDFVAYIFSQFNPTVEKSLENILGKAKSLGFSGEIGFSLKVKPSELGFDEWLKLFSIVIKNNGTDLNVFKGALENILRQQEKLSKVYRSRVDKNWKRFV